MRESEKDKKLMFSLPIGIITKLVIVRKEKRDGKKGRGSEYCNHRTRRPMRKQFWPMNC